MARSMDINLLLKVFCVSEGRGGGMYGWITIARGSNLVPSAYMRPRWTQKTANAIFMHIGRQYSDKYVGRF